MRAKDGAVQASAARPAHRDAFVGAALSDRGPRRSEGAGDCRSCAPSRLAGRARLFRSAGVPGCIAGGEQAKRPAQAGSHCPLSRLSGGQTATRRTQRRCGGVDDDLLQSLAARVGGIGVDQPRCPRRNDDRRHASAQSRIPPGTVPRSAFPEWLQADVVTIAVPSVLVCRASRSEAEVHEVAKTIYEQRAVMTQLASAYGRLTADFVLDGLTAPIHPGAQRYFASVDVTPRYAVTKRSTAGVSKRGASRSRRIAG